jgi:hypothetical protein
MLLLSLMVLLGLVYVMARAGTHQPGGPLI